jgi:hypothetical protein
VFPIFGLAIVKAADEAGTLTRAAFVARHIERRSIFDTLKADHRATGSGCQVIWTAQASAATMIRSHAGSFVTA